MNKTIKLVGMDLDGTLLNSQNRLTEYTRNILKAAIAQGCVIVPATGRPLTALPKELLEFPGIQYAVTANGARIVAIKEQEAIYESLLPMETAEEILEMMMDYDVSKEFFADGVGYTDAETIRNAEKYFTPVFAEYMRNSRIPIDNLKRKLHELGKPVDKVQGLFHNEAHKKEVAKKLENMQGILVTSALGHNLEVNSAGASKGLALLKLGEILGIQREEIMACGDGTNDSEMLRTVGIGVAMENAAEEVKALADYITDSNDNDGVAKAIEKFVLG